MTSRWGPKPRTRKDMVADVERFCVTATWDAFQRKSLDDLIRMAGGDVQAAKYWQARRLGRGE